MEPFKFDVGSGSIAGIRSTPAGASRARLIAFHGGGYDHHYWHDPENSAASLPLLGAELGFETLVPDRPGYAGSRDGWPTGLSVADQVDVLGPSALFDTQLPVFVIGHSTGGSLAIAMAASAYADRIAAIDVSGVALRYPPETAERRSRLSRLTATGASHLPAFDLNARRAVFFSDPRHYDAAVPARTPDNPMPTVEYADAVTGPAIMPEQMRHIRCPVRWTAAAHEATSETGEPLLSYVRGLLTMSRYVETWLQDASGHNVSQHHVARAYHLRAFAFFEEVMARRL
ncbi:MAG: alpha/beta fold hydrolase [Gammaproteobacteria bacterium]